ncbi:DUF4065 domain-containing protein [Rhodococcus opacus]|uniref:DUF4065 domain-containing protein n=1 Tax=Rhodococcus opacus TaxID=37919 RepID=A0AAX3YAF4_RHOOP|nr:type II toxin-antitoxin system antitoxin SocA domain-containing protein [Rhodococcus opacus]MCZ4586471.1 DUF4065 domain-containing protein [Rhodococcus opacus]WLF45039.1 DUF4065 domain-containing protein [Rhodococcus opacus]
MVTALDVAGYVYKHLGWVDAWKLEKLTYFAQAWHLAWDGRPLFDDEIQAWADGPVIPKVHRVNKFHRMGAYDTELPGSHPEAVVGSAERVIQAVLDFYGGMDKHTLIELTHGDSPWLEARGDLAEGEMGNETISVKEMRRCYSRKALEGEQCAPRPPSMIPAQVQGGPRYQRAIDHEMERWAETLALLAER